MRDTWTAAGHPAASSDWTAELRLLAVSRPARYAGLVIRPGPAARDAAVSVGLAAPEVYEDALGDAALRAAARVFARAEGIAWDLYCAPWMDMEAALVAGRAPLRGVVDGRPAAENDLLCFVTRDELEAPTLLAMLALAGIPRITEERRREGTRTIVLLSGRLAWNPEPFHAFADGFLLGDLEPALDEVLRLARDGAFERAARPARLEMLAAVPGVYVPSLGGGGSPGASALAPSRARRRVLDDLDRLASPAAPALLATGEIAHDAAIVEVQRGCGGGCRACRERGAWRPAARRTAGSVVDEALSGLAAGGWDELALIAPRGADGAYLDALAGALAGELLARRAALQLPVLRPRDVSASLLSKLAALRRTRLVLAPEISPEISDWEPLLAALDAIGRAGWRAVDLSIALGPPGLEPVTRDILPRIFRQLTAAGRRADGSRLAISLTLRAFTPRAHTVYQWEGAPAVDAAAEVLAFYRARLTGPRVRLRWDDPGMIAARAALALGGRELAPVIESAWRRGARFAHRRDVFDLAPWLDAFGDAGIALAAGTPRRSDGEPLPWAHLAMSAPADLLLAERERLRTLGIAADCHLAGTPDLRMDPAVERPEARAEGTAVARPRATENGGVAAPAGTAATPATRGRGRVLRRAAEVAAGPMRVRMAYSVHGPLRFLSHLDTVRLFDRLLRRAALPVEYSQGTAPHPRISFGPPRAVGMSSLAEYVDIGFAGPFTGERRAALGGVLPAGMAIRRVMPLYGPRVSLDADINAGAYRVTVRAGGEPTPLLAGEGDWSRPAAGAVPSWLASRAECFAASHDATLRRVTPKKVQEVDVRASLLEYDWDISVPGELALHLLVAHGGRRRARPSEVAAALLGLAPENAGLLRIERTGLYWKEPSGPLRDPFGDRHEDAWTPLASAPGEPRRDS